MKKEPPQLKIRLPLALKENIVKIAKENNRSINAEIEYLLQKSLILEETRADSNSAIDKIISLIAGRTTRIVERELALDILSSEEKILLTKIDNLPKQKRNNIIEIFISLLKLI